jgi:transposase
MPNFKPLDYSPRFLAGDLSRQLVSGTEIEARYRNDDVVASAYEPRVLLKIILLAYSYGIVSSRAMQAACCDNVRFIAISGDSQPDHSTLASFVSGLGEAIARVFTQVLMVCNRQGLIGREMFAIDGVKLPSNASKAKSGKRRKWSRRWTRSCAGTGTMMSEL